MKPDARMRNVRRREKNPCCCTGRPDVVYLYTCSAGHTIEQPICMSCIDLYGGYKKLKPSVCVECFAAAQDWYKRSLDVRFVEEK